MGVKRRSLFEVEGKGDRVCGCYGCDRCLMLRFRRSGVLGDEGRSLVDVGNRRSGFVGRGDRWLI